MVFRCGRIAHDIIRDTAIGNLIGALLHIHRSDRSHRLDAVDINLQKRLEKSEDGVEFPLRVLTLTLRTRKGGEMRDAAKGSSVDRQGSAKGKEGNRLYIKRADPTLFQN